MGGVLEEVDGWVEKEQKATVPPVKTVSRYGEECDCDQNASESSVMKRQDLQGTRGLAILAVVGFHFFPNYIPNGRLGVDQFFVLSGFLMFMLLDKAKENQSIPDLLMVFYTRRLKRILPLYFLIIVLSLIFLYQCFPDASIRANHLSASKAVLLISNREVTVEEDFLDMFHQSINIFAHTWSLSVEVQYYLIAPLIFLIGAWTKKFQLIYYFFIGSLSFLSYWFLPGIVDFYNLPARIWQFTIGMIAFQGYQLSFQNPVDKKELSKIDKNWVLISLKYASIITSVLIIFYPYRLNFWVTRPVVTLLTGLITYLPDNDKLLSNSILSYLGDISYSLYLIHYPIYAYWALTSKDLVYASSVAITLSVLLAVISYEFFEKWYLKLSNSSIGVMVVALVLLNLKVMNMGQISKESVLDTPETTNHRWSVNFFPNLYTPFCPSNSDNSPFGWCNHSLSLLSPDAPYQLAIFGNSWAANHGSLFYEECGQKARSILQGAEIGCEPLYPTWNRKICRAKFAEFEKRIREEKPDYGFLVTRYLSVGEPPYLNDKKLDPVYEVMKNQTSKLVQNIKKKLFILNALPKIKLDSLSVITKSINNQTELARINAKSLDLWGYEAARKRYSRLISDCGDKCELIDYKDVFTDKNGNFRFFNDQGLAFLTTSNQLTPLGLEKVRPIWRKICREL